MGEIRLPARRDIRKLMPGTAPAPAPAPAPTRQPIPQAVEPTPAKSKMTKHRLAYLARYMREVYRPAVKRRKVAGEAQSGP
jgi:hypothetical protein